MIMQNWETRTHCWENEHHLAHRVQARHHHPLVECGRYFRQDLPSPSSREKPELGKTRQPKGMKYPEAIFSLQKHLVLRCPV